MARAHGLHDRLVAVLIFCITFHAVLIGWTDAASTVDVARNKPTTAVITCGTFGRETYFTHSEAYQTPSSRTLQICYNSSSHPASAMVDGRLDTWWQSTARDQIFIAGYGLNGKPEAIIDIDLDQYFEVDTITLTMGNSRRPGTMILYKSVDGIRYIPWIYRVSKDEDCRNIYQLPVLATPRTINSKICSGYSNRFRAVLFEKIEFDLSAVDPSLAAWRNLRFLRIEFYKMHLTLGINGVKFQHYTVSELTVEAECVCNGQALSCQVDHATGQYQCVCGGNTTGLFCEQCEPFSNQFEFFYGRPCEECNCFGHADSCFYDPVTANFSRSLDSQGVYRGGGVCNDCQHHTAGVNCNKCHQFYYRPLGVDQRSVNACQPCECHGPGVAVNPLSGLTGDCIMNDDTLLPLGMIPGDCLCKPNVTGAKCGQCKVGFYNLDANNPAGCTDCRCNTVGTVSGSPVCNATNGQCPCKTHLMGNHCEDCKDEYYDMTQEDPDGCKACQCDVGGSYSNVCDKQTGQCPCRRNIGDRQCKTPLPGSYSPDPHFLHGEFESIRSSWDRAQQGYTGFGYATLSDSVSGLTLIEIPTETNLRAGYYLLLRYECTKNATGTAFIFASGVPTISTSILFPACPNDWCYLRVQHNKHQLFNLVPGKTYTIRVSIVGKLKLDQAVALPWEYTNGTIPLGAEADTFHTTCDVFTNDMKLGTADETFCLTTLFSLTSYYLNGALPCDCHFLGTHTNTTCDAYGGQCNCNTGVGGRRCHDCLLEYFNLQEGGCQPCGCGSDYKVCDSVTGHCVCPPNIVGRKCDQCMFNHWNWTAQHGCEPCECNPIGSASLQCNQTSGECRCKPGVLGPKCHVCEPGYKSFSWTGCVPCDCNVLGSVSDTCNARSGQCPCKENTVGLHCERCKGGTYNLKAEHSAGCLKCICMGVTQQCTSSTWRLSTNTIPVVGSGANNHTTNFNIVTEKETVIMELSVTDHDGMLMAQADVGSQPRQYWAPIDGLHGHLVALYDNTIHFTVRYTAADPSGLPLVNNKLIIISNHKGRRFYLDVPSVARGVTTQINVTVATEHLVGPSENASRGELLAGLQDVQMVLIPASYYDRMHTSSIGHITYQMAAPDGTGPQALSTESCACPAGYEGQSCERCAPGYLRKQVDTHDYLGLCRPCECHNHATTCDPDTGECIDCRHNTAGPTCEFCQTGFYGSAEMGTPYDCLPCPCYEPRVANGTCLVNRGRISCLYCAPGYTGSLCDTCDTFYFGNPELVTFGKCEKCFCNGNSDSCDRKTGQCLNCQHSTTGHECQNCSDGFYGNASNHDCQPCTCDVTGSRSTVCDHETGQCDCFDGVGGRTCDVCLPDHYGFNNASFAGCMPCECNPFGSSDTQCDDTGICTCKPNAQDTKCNVCSGGFWGLPYEECQACACDAVGSVDPAAPCEPVMGQCTCKSGVAGRQCEKCQFLHVGFGPDGCTACNDCQFSMGNDTTALKDVFHGYWAEVQMIGEVQMLDSQMQVLADHIAVTSASLGLSTGHLDTLTEGSQNLSLAEPLYNRTVQELLDKGSLLEQQAELLDNASLAELSRQEAFRDIAKTSHEGALRLNTSGPGILARLESFKSTAEKLQVDSGQTSSGMSVNFDKEEAAIAETVANITAEAAGAERMLIQAETTGNLTTQLENLTSSAETQLRIIETEIADAELLMAGVKVRADSVANSFNITKHYKQQAEALFAESQTLVNMTEVILTSSKASYSRARVLLDDASNVLHGVPDGPLPVDASLVTDQDSLAGVWSWTQSSGKLNVDLNSTLILLRSRESKVTNMEVMAQALTNQVQALVDEFKRVQPLGERAVEAINKYAAVAKTLEESVRLALEANRTVGGVMSALQEVSVNTLESLAAQSLEESQRVVDELRRQQATSEKLQQRLRTANATLTNGVTQWENRYELSDVFLKAAEAISELAKDTNSGLEEDKPLVAEPIEEAYIAADAAIATADAVLAQNAKAQPLISAQARMASLIREENNNATKLVNTISDELDTFQRVVRSDMRSTLDVTESLRQDTAALRTQIETQMDAIEEKIERAMRRLEQMEQSVGLTTSQHEVLVNPAANTVPSWHTEIHFDFQVTLRAQGVLFFAENNQTDEMLKISMRGEELAFSFNNGDGLITARSLANICGGCWFRVVATRYGIDSHLAVTRLRDGALTTTHTRGRTRADRLSLNTPIFVGGLPSNYLTTKVTDEDGEFEGCFNNMYMNGQRLELWKTILQQESNAQCCGRPPSLPGPLTIPGAFALSGFGYYQMPATNVSIATMSHMQFRFRTFDDSGVMLLVDRQQVSNYYGLFMVQGQVMLKMGGLGWEQSLLSARTYSDGEWYQLTAMHNATYVLLVVEYVDKSISPLVDVRSAAAVDHSLQRLQDGVITIGNQNPNTQSRGPVADYFAGCVSHVKFALPGDPTLQDVNVPANAQTYGSTSTQYCYQQVTPGLGFTDSTSYARLTNTRKAISVVQFLFQTYEPSGLIMYAQRPEGTAPYFYIAIFNGDIFVMFNQGSGIQPVLRTRGMYLSDGREHEVLVDFSYQNNPRLTVNGEVHHGAIQMTPNMVIMGGAVYVGGVPSTLVLPAQFPAHGALIGGLRNIRINTKSIDLYSSSSLDKQYQKFAWLSGLPAPRSAPPPIPYSTTPAPPTTPHPTCAAPYELTFSQRGMRFGHTTESYIAYDTKATPNLFTHSFTITVEFRAVQPNGILVYAAGSEASNPTYYFSLFLEDGRLVFNMDSNSKVSNANPPRTKRIMSRYTYNTGQWVEATVLRINDFIALVVTQNRDYRNNGMSSSTVSTLQINTLLYIGGVPTSFVGLPFVGDHDIRIGNVPFHGCIRKVKVATHSPEPVIFDLANPDIRVGTMPCFDTVQPGIFLNATDSYIKVQKPNSTPLHNVVPNFRVSLTLHGTVRQGALLIAYQSFRNFFLIEIFDGEVRGILSDGGDLNHPFIFSSKDFLGPYVLCDNEVHTIEVGLGFEGVVMQVDNLTMPYKYPQGFLFAPIYSESIYVGGHPDPTWVFPTQVTRRSFHGCMNQFVLNGEEYVLAQMQETFGVFSGCPAPPIP